MALTTRKINATKPGAKIVTLSDGMGLELRISPNGSRGWRLRYTRPNGKRNMISLGNYPDVSLAEAREKRTDLKRLIAKGIDPVEHKQNEKRALKYATENTFRVLAMEWHAAMVPRWKESSKRASDSRRVLEMYVFPKVGDRSIEGILPLEWLEILRTLEDAGKFEQRRRLHAFCRDIYRFAIITGRATYNPLTDLQMALKPYKRGSFHHIPQSELPQLVRDIEAYDKSPMVRIGLKLLLLTAVRPGELRNAEWAEFDLDAAVWKIPAERMKMGRAHQVPLPTQAIDELRYLHKLTGPFKLLFPGRNNPRKPISDAAFGMALKRMGYEGRHVPHGCRHVVATGLKELGYPREWIELQLSHKLPGIEGVYTHAEHMAPEQRPAMMQFWADYLLGSERHQGGPVP
ncbi:integrase arm-type DNA-binding domain-containing protein [Halomonas aquamarina]|uniref:Integrase arm-type DNA-binding domain-containing protein n=1 Tax=Vreelandella aquamarina TaxID=77097 RepID=A0ACC5VQY0_9GAMM|nr:integrase arm-type DNA-binding domain-containing protein [Halomonas aquamarina]MBZ5486482.1 integrase arm-type DNA-binding domain-containing protein [Halomonas aquamarina]